MKQRPQLSASVAACARFSRGLLFSFTLLACLLAGAPQAQAQQWSQTGALGTARSQHTATLLANGKVLAVGGLVGCAPMCQTTKTAELYDPATGTWSGAAALPEPVGNHAAVRLQDGKVLVMGGYSSPGVLLRTAYLYDPDTGAWSPAGNLRNARQFHTAVLLPSGKVLVAGGLVVGRGRFVPTETAELYDPATNTWGGTGAMSVPRVWHTMTLLPSGKVLVATGANTILDAPPFFTPVRSCELYDPAMGNWSMTGEVGLPRSTPTATLLPGGKVLLAGGTDNNTTEVPTNKTELYDPATGQWGATGNLTVARDAATDALLPDGKVLLAGGYGDQPELLKNADLYDPATGTWSTAGEIGRPRIGHTATLLNNGRVMIAAGHDDPENSMPFGDAELYEGGGTTVGALASVSAATFVPDAALASEAMIAAFGSNLATETQTAPTTPLPTTLAGTSVRVRDSLGVERLAPLFFVSPSQINYQIPPGTAAGQAALMITSGGSIVAAGGAMIAGVAPGLFAANSSGRGVAAAFALRVKVDGAQSFEPVAQFDAGQNRFVAAAVDLGPETDQVFLVLYGTGIKFRSALSAINCAVGGVGSEVLFADAAPGFVGLDQVNVRLPRSLAGRGEVDVALLVDGRAANMVRVSIR